MTLVDSCDVLVIGGGMAGASIGCELAADRRVLVADMEHTLAYHTTGRSAAMFLETYGSPAIRALTSASREYLEHPPGAERLLTPLAMLYIGRPGQQDAVADLHRDVSTRTPDVALLDGAEAVRLQPLLRPGSVESALLEPAAMEIDVHALHQGYVRGLRARGASTVVDAAVAGASRAQVGWAVTMSDGRTVAAEVVVNAAGAWADQVAELFGAAPVGLRALRRSAFMVDAPPGTAGPMICDIHDAFYVKPDAGRLLCSPADETPQTPGDAKPDELEIARAIEVINEVTTLDVRHIRTPWAGLRNFVADRNPVIGYDPAVEGFFWFAGQGGYGIQTAPALSRTGAALLRGEALPADVVQRGLTAAELSPARSMPGAPPEWGGG
jgi:D-arginine dehydrogenase